MSDSKLQVVLTEWCDTATIEVTHAILVVGVGSDLGVAEIEEELHTVRCWSRVRVRGTKPYSDGDGLLVLCECREVINPNVVPPEVRPKDGAVWKIITHSQQPTTPALAEEFSTKLQRFLTSEGKTLADIQSMSSTDEAVLRAMVDVVSRTTKNQAESHGYRRLRIFSGITPTPAGEESLEYWLEQATLMVQESELTEQEKRRQILECLRGPALEIIKALRLSNQGATSQEFLDALDSAFGSAESAEDLYFSFRLIQQKAGEKLSDYVRRIEPVLAKVVKKGGVSASDKDKVRIEQLLRGAVDSDLMLLQLRLKERRTKPPNFLDLLAEIRTEEEYQRTRKKVNACIRNVAVCNDSVDNDVDIEVLKADFKALKTQVFQMSKGSAGEGASAYTSMPNSGHSGNDKSEAAALRKKVKKLSKKLKSKGGNATEPSATVAAVGTKSQSQGSRQAQSPAGGECFCYRCGEDGHIATKCSFAENEKKVIKRLIASLNKAKGKQSNDGNANCETTNCFSKKQEVRTNINALLPKGLIGPPSTVKVKVNGRPCTAILDNSPVPNEWKERLRGKLCRRRNVFSLHEWEVGLAKGVEHNIRLTDPRPFRERSRRLAPADIEDVRKHLQELLDTGVIKESRSPYASPIVVTRKKNGNVRMCIDYRTLNSKTIPDQYTTPRIDDALDCLAGSRWFSVLDLRSGYYQIAMAEEDKDKTAFICPLGFYQFEHMSPGVMGAPATFQRLMEKAVGDMNLLQVLVYLDDLIVFGATLEEHEERLIKVLDRLGEVGLKVSLDKCQFCQPRVKYVGHIVSADGRKGKKPTVAKDRQYYKEAEPFGSRWTDACTKAFREIIRRLTNAPVLAFADPNKRYVLHIDASLRGLGAVLNQVHLEGLRPVAFASRGLTAAEQKYHIHQLEFLALKWAVVDEFHDYLYGVRFTVMTDNNPLTYVLTTGKLNATGHRWLAALATYDFEVKYRPGKVNIDADLLSRIWSDVDAEPWKRLCQGDVKTLCSQVCEQDVCMAERLGVPVEGIPELYSFATHLNIGHLEQFTREDLQRAQLKDSALKVVREALNTGHWPSHATDADVPLLKRESVRLRLEDGLLCRVTTKASGKEHRQLLLPKEFRMQVCRALHDDMGHLGVERSLELIRERFFWPKMSQTVETYIGNCGKCVTWKSPCPRAAPLHQITSTGPMELVCIDFLSVEPDSSGFGNILVVTDHFSRYAQAYPTKDQRAVTVAKVLVEKYFVHYGLPARIYSDQGRDFESRLIQELLRTLGIRKSWTTPYHPQGDPQPERFNRTLLSMLGTLRDTNKRQWSRHVSQLVHAYNSTKNDATGYSPYYIMFGREARLPIDVCFGTDDQGPISHSRYVEDLKRELKSAYELATKSATQVHLRNKKNYERVLRSQVLAKGDRVLLKNLGLKGKHKLQSRWNSLPYVIVEKLPDLPVYRVKPESGMGKLRTIHRDNILPIGSLVRISDESDVQEQSTKPVTRSQRKSVTRQSHVTRSQGKAGYPLDEESSDSDSEYQPMFRWRSEPEDLEDPVSDEDHECEVQNTAGEQDSVSNDEEDECDVMLEAIVDSSDGWLDAADEVETPVEPIGSAEPERHSPVSVTGEARPQRTSPRREKRSIKPVIRLTYDEVGKPKDQPLTIVHRGVVIKIG
ncbi:hypothetical protein MHYP_G00049810 [Metynnis hypsauchen]